MTEKTRTWQKAGGGGAQDDNKESHGVNKQTVESTCATAATRKHKTKTEQDPDSYFSAFGNSSHRK